MGRRFIWMLALVTALGSCTDDSTASPSSTSAQTTAETTLTTAAAPSDPGRLAVIDGAGDVAVVGPDGSDLVPITDNGGSPDNPASYMQPVWSPDAATLSWGQTTGTGFGVGLSEPGSDLITTLTTPNLPFFTYWSPDSRHLGVLHNGTTGVQFQIADTEEETTSLLDEDAPFYFSWSPDGDRVVTHAGATRAETIATDGERVGLEPTTGNYLAPQWTESGVFHVVDDRLVLEDGAGRRRPVAAVSGLALFVANPGGTRVALLSTGRAGDGITASAEELPGPTIGAVVVVDVATGDLEVVERAPALGFFWSPDGESLLVLATDGGRIVPRVWEGSGDTTVYRALQPPPSMLRDMFPFFPQYAQSMSPWAPASSAFAYAGRQGEEEDGIWVQTLDGDPPHRVTDGSWVAWSAARP